MRILIATQTGGIVGTPLYMPPEAVRSEEVAFSADVFAFGVLAYELLLGRHPFDSPPMLLSRSVFEERSASRSWQGITNEMANMLARCLAFAPDERPTASEIATVFTSRATE
jgi:serine/threonine-protein kinase